MGKQEMNNNLVVHCKKSAFDVYIGRQSKGAPKGVTNFEWGNPFVMRRGKNQVEERKRVIREYKTWIIQHPDLIQKARMELKGKVLGCWCSPLDCHGHILSWIANSEEGSLPFEVEVNELQEGQKEKTTTQHHHKYQGETLAKALSKKKKNKHKNTKHGKPKCTKKC